MSFVFSKNKEKRSRSSTGESNSSFVKNVTSRVSGLLSAGINKWFSSPSSSSANGSAAIADGTDSSTEDEAPESPSMIQPPAKRIRYASPAGKYNLLTTSETTTTSNVVTESGSVLYTSIQSPPGRHTFRRDTNFVSSPIRAQTDDTVIMNSMMERNDRENPYTQQTVSAIGQSIALKRKSLFDTNTQREQSLIACAKTAAHQVKDIKQPHFKPHLLGSSFYPGLTMYGGASASHSYMNVPNIQQQKMTYVNESRDADAVNMSTSSRRVMDLLENYSSPLIEAKRIPRYELSELRDIKSSIQPSTSKSHSYKTQELYVPTTATMIRMKARSRLMDSTKAARQIIASHSSTLSHFHKPYPVSVSNSEHPDSDSGQSKSQSKLKSRLTRPNRGEDPFGMPETVELPTAVLQIDKNNLPKFTFEVSTPNPSEKKPSDESFKIFKFSSPLPITPGTKTADSRAPLAFDFDSPEKAVVNTTPPKFLFEKQTNQPPITEPQPEKKDEPTKTQTTENTVITFAKASNKWSCSECWVLNNADAEKCACCGAKQPSKQTAVTPSKTTSKCTTCKLSNTQSNSDVCVNCEKMRASLNSTNSLPVTKKVKSSKWECGDCWIGNEESAEKCVCCGSRNPRKGTPAAALPNNQPAAPVFTEKDWRCEDCFITNKPAMERCAACGGAKPGTKLAAKTLPSITSTNIFKDTNNKMAEVMETQMSYWECSVCLASNANEKLTCMCCDAKRYPNDNAKPQFANFKFSTDSNAGFKFGIDPKVQETNLAKKVDETPKPKNTEESETNNNIVPKVPSFSFTLPAKKPSDKVDNTKTVEEVKPSFSFGIQNQNATVASSFVPISAPVTKLPDIVKPAEDKEKPQEVPSVTFKAPEATKPSTGPFSSPAPTANPLNAMNAFLKTSAEVEKVSPNRSPIHQSATLDTPNLQFSFSTSAVKPTAPSAGGLFNPPESTAASNSLAAQTAPTSSLAMETFSKPEPTVAPAMSFFSKPETTPAPSTTLFQNNIQSNLAAPASTTPMFSFGNIQNSNPAPVNEPKSFNFGFGSSTTTTTFGAAQQTNSTTFNNLPAANPLTNGPTNPLGGSSISTNPLARSITGNPLGGTGGNGLTASGNGMLGSNSASMFNAPVNENTSMWPSAPEQTNQANPFIASTLAKPTFSFGSTPAPSPFGQTSNTQPIMFGGNSQPAQSMFGIDQNNASQSPMFTSPAMNQPTPMFGGAQTSAPTQPMGMFGAAGASPFASSNASMNTCETPTPTFNFGAPQPSAGVFGFGQQPQQIQQPQMQQSGMQQMQQMQQAGIQPGVYNFGGAASPAPGQMQFNMGSAPSSTAGRRMRKAVRKHQR